jgi:hypothetical protein
LIFKNWKGKATDEIRNERIRTTHHTKLFVAYDSEHVAEVVGELSQFKIVLSKIGKKEQGTRYFRNKEKRQSDEATEGRRYLLLRISHCELMADPTALLCALRASAVKKVDDFAPLQQMRILFKIHVII